MDMASVFSTTRWPWTSGDLDEQDEKETGVSSTVSESAFPDDRGEYTEIKIANFIRKYYQLGICLFGIIGNLLSLVVLLQKPMRSKTTYMYMLVVSVADTTTLVIAVMWWLQGRSYVDMNSVWYCKLVLFFFYLAIHTSVGSLVAMTIERYLAVRFPLKAKGWINRRRAAYAIAGVLLLMLTIDLHNLWTRTMIITSSGSTMCLFSNIADEYSKYGYFHLYIWPWIDATTYSFVPLAMLSVLNVLIIRSVTVSAKRSMSFAKDNAKGQEKMAAHSATEKQVTTMLLSVTTAFILLTGPIAAFLIVEKLWHYESNPHHVAIYKLIRAVVSNLMYTNHAINVLIYCVTGRAFRTQLKALFMGKEKKPNQGSMPNTSSQVSQISGKTRYPSENHV